MKKIKSLIAGFSLRIMLAFSIVLLIGAGEAAYATIYGQTSVNATDVYFYQTYSSASEFYWSVDGGQVISGGGMYDNYISVRWNLQYSGQRGVFLTTMVMSGGGDGTLQPADDPYQDPYDPYEPYPSDPGYPTYYSYQLFVNMVQVVAGTAQKSHSGTVCKGTGITLSYTGSSNISSVSWQRRRAGTTDAWATVNTNSNASGNFSYTYSIQEGSEFRAIATPSNGTAPFYSETGPVYVYTIASGSVAPTFQTCAGGTVTLLYTGSSGISSVNYRYISGYRLMRDGTEMPIWTSLGSSSDAATNYAVQVTNVQASIDIEVEAYSACGGSFLASSAIRVANSAPGTATTTSAMNVCSGSIITLNYYGQNINSVTWQRKAPGASESEWVNIGTGFTFQYAITLSSEIRAIAYVSCGGPYISNILNFQVDTPLIVGKVYGSRNLQPAANAGQLFLTDYVGYVLKWRKSEDKGLNWVDIPGSAGDVFSYANVEETTYFKAVVSGGACGNVQESEVAVISIDQLNWVQQMSYGESGIVTGESRSYFDGTGKPVQNQVRNVETNTILASQPLYDRKGDAAGQSLIAPVGSGAFQYRENFITAGSQPYDYRHFDKPVSGTDASQTITNAVPVDKTTPYTLGWYYSANNTLEPLVGETAFPYSRVEFYSDGSGEVKRVAGPGDEVRLGKGHEAVSNTFPVINELEHYLQIRQLLGDAIGINNSTTPIIAVQQVGIDQNGQWGITIADAEGKALLSAKPGNWKTIPITAEVLPYRYAYYMDWGTDMDHFKEVALSGGAPVRAYKMGASYTGNDYVYDGNAASFPTIVREKLVIFSTQPFHVSYQEMRKVAVSGDDATFTVSTPADLIREKSAVPSSDMKNFHSFYLSSSAVVAVTGGAYELVNTVTEQPVVAGTLPAGFYKIIATGTAPVQIAYTNSYGDISYNFYNQLGQVVASMAPNGIELMIKNPSSYTGSNLPFTSFYAYDLQGRLTAKTETDAGRTEFAYQKDGTIRFSQNEEQRKTGRYSYVNYDVLVRPVEYGEFVPGTTGTTFAVASTTEGILNSKLSTGGLVGGTRADVITIVYDLPQSTGLTGYTQEFVKGKVATISNENGKTFHSYDSQGRLIWTVQDIIGLGKKSVDYTFDMTGKLLTVCYQKNVSAERFTHYYTYDKAGRLSEVRTNRALATDAAAVKDLQVKYYFYLHGPLKRVELAEKLQGIDYVYTVQGWLKSINHADVTRDLGGDAAKGFAKDVFGMTLEYFSGDYVRTGSSITQMSGISSIYAPQFNGIIRAMGWQTQTGTINAEKMYAYQYDSKYQLLSADWGKADYSNFTFTKSTANINREYGLAYDANGNIKNLLRTDVTGAVKDNFSYTFLSNTNKLQKVEHMGSGGTAPSLYSQYGYNAIGQMEYESVADGSVKFLSYDVSGKVKAVFSDAAKTKLRVSFHYNASGQRVKKIDYDVNGIAKYTYYYVRDIAGQELALYDNNGSALALKEVPVYASSRIGALNAVSGTYSYQLSDHIGNIRAVIARSKVNGLADVMYYTDYYSFGGEINSGGSETPRQGYQGQFAVKDQETGWNSFELRMYNSRIARWTSKDPYGQFFSPYVGMGNNPVVGTDPDGGWCPTCPKGAKDGSLYIYNEQKYVYSASNNDWFATSDEVLVETSRDFVGGEIWDFASDYMTGAGIGIDGGSFTVGRVLDKRLAYEFSKLPYERWGKASVKTPSTNFNTPIGNVRVNTSFLKGTAKFLKVGGATLGVVGGVMTLAEIANGNKRFIGEGGVDLVMGGVAFIPGGGWIVSGAYFGGKLILEETGNDFWNK